MSAIEQDLSAGICSVCKTPIMLVLGATPWHKRGALDVPRGDWASGPLVLCEGIGQPAIEVDLWDAKPRKKGK